MTAPYAEYDPNSEPERTLLYGMVDNGNGQYNWRPLLATLNSDGLATLSTTASTSFVTNAGSTAALTQVASSVISVTLLAANTNTRSVIIANNSTSWLYVAFAATASASAFTYPVAPGGVINEQYNGVISGIWTTANGNAQVTQITA